MLKCIIILFVLTTLSAVQSSLVISKRAIMRGFNDHCQMGTDKWKCCVSTPPVRDFILTGCVDLELLRKDMGMKMVVTLNNYTIYDGEISVKNPPAVCDEVPYLEELIQVCIKFYDMDINWDEKRVKGCLRLEGHLIHRKFVQIPIGCFDFPMGIQWVRNEMIRRLQAKVKDFVKEQKMDLKRIEQNDVNSLQPSATLVLP